MAEEMKNKLESRERRMMRTILQPKRKSITYPQQHTPRPSKKSTTTNHHDPEHELEEDTTEIKPQNPNLQEESNQAADSSLSYDGVLQGETEDELEPWVDFTVRPTHKAFVLLAANGVTAGSFLMEHHHERRWTKLISNWNPSISTKQKRYLTQGRPRQEMERRNQFFVHPTKTHIRTTRFGSARHKTA